MLGECGMRNENLPAAVIFDMDGLLVDSEPLHAKAFITVFGESGLRLTIEGFLRSVTLGGMNTRDLYLSMGGNGDEWDNVILAKHQTFGAILKEKGSLMPGAIDLLDSLRAAQIPMAIATSARRRSLEIINDHFDLGQYFAATIAYEDAQADKPDPTAFLLAAERLCAPRAECVVLEDSPRGVIAAHRAGMKCIAVPNASTADGDFSSATLVVDSLERVDIQALHRLWKTMDSEH